MKTCGRPGLGEQTFGCPSVQASLTAPAASLPPFDWPPFPLQLPVQSKQATNQAIKVTIMGSGGHLGFRRVSTRITATIHYRCDNGFSVGMWHGSACIDKRPRLCIHSIMTLGLFEFTNDIRVRQHGSKSQCSLHKGPLPQHPDL